MININLNYFKIKLSQETFHFLCILLINISTRISPRNFYDLTLRRKENAREKEGKTKAKSRNEIQFPTKRGCRLIYAIVRHPTPMFQGSDCRFPLPLAPFSFASPLVLYGVPREQEGQSCESIQEGPPSLDRLLPTIGSRRPVSLSLISYETIELLGIF